VWDCLSVSIVCLPYVVGPRGLHRSGQNLVRQPYFIDNLRGHSVRDIACSGCSSTALCCRAVILKRCAEQITKVAVGVAHVLAVDSEGTVFSWGTNDDHQLGGNECPGFLSRVLIALVVTAKPRRVWNGPSAVRTGHKHSSHCAITVQSARS
jgi:hypothetical protein